MRRGSGVAAWFDSTILGWRASVVYEVELQSEAERRFQDEHYSD